MSPPRPPSAARCSLALLAVRAHLKLRGFGPSVALARRLAGEVSAGGIDGGRTDDIGRTLAERTARGVAVAGALFPGRAVCLEQSLALFVLLRRRGVPAELRIGVQARPFHAHAWVELDGEPVNEDAETVARFRVLPEAAP